jgi:NAD-reducing hydrogenase large subunit
MLPEAHKLVLFALEIWYEHKGRFVEEMGNCGDFPSLFLGLLGADECLDHTTGRLRFVDADGIIVNEFAPEDYALAISESVTSDSYMKPTSCTLCETGLYRAGPLARLNVAPYSRAPQANHEREKMLAGKKVTTASLDSHHARLIEMLCATEKIAELLDDPGITDCHVLARGNITRAKGVGATEAPRGTLIHDYRVDNHGLLTNVNLLVATGHNSRAMDRTITDIARRHIRGNRLTEGLLNRVEHAIRLYDPCLSCATHAAGKMGITVELQDCEQTIIDRKTV